VKITGKPDEDHREVAKPWPGIHWGLATRGRKGKIDYHNDEAGQEGKKPSLVWYLKFAK